MPERTKAPERLKTVVAIALTVTALAVVVIGFARSPGAAPTDEQRVASLAASIRCPFCNGESLADSGSGVAADYRALIAERVAAGASDEQIRQEFAENFGEAYLLDSSSRWSVALWLVPLAALVGGGAVILWMRRASRRREEVAA
jgi:cytochrome c-type biogenesis protein CcmH